MGKPLAIRRFWHYVEYASFVERTDASTRPPPPFVTSAPPNVPPAVLDEALKIYAESENQNDPAKAKDLISKLVSDPRMNSVWKELYRKTTSDDKNPISDFVNPIYVKKASIAAALRRRASELRANTLNKKVFREAAILDAEAKLCDEDGYDPLAHTPWPEQDLGVQLFLWQTYHAALDPKPEYLSEIKAEVKALRKAAQQLRAQAVKLQSLRIKCDTLEQIASDCDRQARSRDVNPRTDNPWVISRRVYSNPEQKTFVAILSGITGRMCGKAMSGTIATITNVVFGTDMEAKNIREMLR
jgi:hypothetical protein